jgi:acetyl esterase/lipase
MTEVNKRLLASLTRREALSMAAGLAAAAVLGAGAGAQDAGHGSSTTADADPMSLVNPELRPDLQKLQREQPGALASVSAANLRQQRERMMQPNQPMLAAPEVVERTIPGPKGAPPVRVYVAGAAPGAKKPAVLHFHGGGYVMGTAATARRGLQQLVLAHDCVAISVEYRLAPETRFPGPLEDNYAALRWMHSHAEELGIDVMRIAVKGESAGGGHAAAIAIAARDRGEFALCFQVLIYPMLDDRTGSSAAVSPSLGHYVWTPASNRFGWSSLLGVPAGSATVPAGAVPARVNDVAGLPPAFIGVGSIDMFAPEDMEYGKRLFSAGIATEVHVVPGAFHAFDEFAADTPITKTFEKAWNDALGKAFTTS